MVQISEVRVGHDAANGLNSTPRRLRFENFQSIQDAGDKTIQLSFPKIPSGHGLAS